MLYALLRCCLGVIELENIASKASDCTTGPKTSQQVKRKLARAEGVRY